MSLFSMVVRVMETQGLYTDHQTLFGVQTYLLAGGDCCRREK
jgi:hypothetical protein